MLCQMQTLLVTLGDP